MYLKRKSFAFNSDRPGVGGEMQRDIFETAMKTVDVTFQVQCLCEAEGIFARPLYLCLSAHHCCPMVCFCVACYVAGLALFQQLRQDDRVVYSGLTLREDHLQASRGS